MCRMRNTCFLMGGVWAHHASEQCSVVPKCVRAEGMWHVTGLALGPPLEEELQECPLEASPASGCNPSPTTWNLCALSTRHILVPLSLTANPQGSKSIR